MANLKVQEPGPKYCHFNRHPDAGYDLNFFNGLLSEKLVLTHTRRGDRWAWEKLPGTTATRPSTAATTPTPASRSSTPTWTPSSAACKGWRKNRRPRSSDGSGHGTTGPTPSTTGKEDTPQ